MSIKKIAEMVGVSASTVSRVLADPKYRCASDTLREEIMEAARKLNYVPNEAARNLKLGVASDKRIRYISILVTRTKEDETDPFFNELLRMVEIEIHKNMCIMACIWYQPVFSDDVKCRTENIDKILQSMHKKDEGQTDGLLIIGKCNTGVLQLLKRYYKNIVSINRNSTNYEVDEVTCDGCKIATLAVEHLIGLGHRKIGYVGDCHNEARFQGYQSTLFRYNLEHDLDYIIEAQPGEAQGYAAMERFMKQENVPTGIYCANDIIAIGMLKCLEKYKNRYYNPSIISSDDIEEAQYTNPMLSTVSLPKEEMVKFAVYLLLDRINGGHKAVLKVELEGTLMKRGSCTSIENTMGCEYYI